MKTIRGLVLLASLVAAEVLPAEPAAPCDPLYGGLGVGVGYADGSITWSSGRGFGKSGLVFRGHVGIQFSPHWALEGATDYWSPSPGSSTALVAFALGGTVRFSPTRNFTIGAGLGFISLEGNAESDGTGWSGSETGMGWKFELAFNNLFATAPWFEPRVIFNAANLGSGPYPVLFTQVQLHVIQVVALYRFGGAKK